MPPLFFPLLLLTQVIFLVLLGFLNAKINLVWKVTKEYIEADIKKEEEEVDNWKKLLKTIEKNDKILVTKDGVVLNGNMRLRACQDLGIKIEESTGK